MKKQVSIALLALLLSDIPFALPSNNSLACNQAFSLFSQKHLMAQKKYEDILTNAQTNDLPFLPIGSTQRLYKHLYNHPVGALGHLSKYDPQGLIGFCFGRSFATFLIAQKMGLKVSAIKNLFIIGDLRSGSAPQWRFHVTSIIRLENGQWYAFDPVLPQKRPVPVALWVQTVQSIWDKQKKSHLYVTSPFHILPDIRNMVIPKNETGRDIIELAFDPTTKSDIHEGHSLGDSLKGQRYFDISDHGYPYFLQAQLNKSPSFLFDKITINEQVIEFNDYFNHLLASDLVPKMSDQMQMTFAPRNTIPPAQFGMSLNYSTGAKYDGVQP